MTSDPARSLPRWIEVLLAFTVVLFALWFADRHVRDNLVHPPTALDLLCRGEGEIPYQHRMLVLWIVESIYSNGIVSKLFTTRMQIAQALEVGFVVSIYYVVRALLARFVGAGIASAAWALLLFYILPFNYLLPRNWPYWYAWDVPTILFFASGMLLIHQRNWLVYYPVFVLATLNRETTCFLTLIFALVSFGRMPFWKLALHGAVQVALWWTITAAIRAAYADNPGVGVYYSAALADNLLMIREPKNWLLIASVFGFLWIPLVAAGRRMREPFARRACLAIPIYFAVSFGTAIFDELRIYGEMVPAVVLGTACLAHALAGRPGGMGIPFPGPPPAGAGSESPVSYHRVPAEEGSVVPRAGADPRAGRGGSSG